MQTSPRATQPFSFWPAVFVMLSGPIVIVFVFVWIIAITGGQGAFAWLWMLIVIFGLASLTALVPIGPAYYGLMRGFGRRSRLRAFTVAAIVGALHAVLSAIAAMFGLGYAFHGQWGSVAPLSILWVGQVPELPIYIVLGVGYGLFSARAGCGSSVKGTDNVQS